MTKFLVSKGDPPQTGPPKFGTFRLLELDQSNFTEWVDIKNKLNLPKMAVTKWRIAIK